MTLAWAGDRPARAKASRIVRGFAWLSLSLLLILLSCLAPTPKSYSAVSKPPKPISILSLCVADLQTVPPHLQRYIRYLDLSHLTFFQRQSWWKVISFHCNQLSTEPLIVRPVVVANSQDALIRLNILDYGPLWEKVYERLAADDPYWHVRLKVQKSGESLAELKAKDKPTKDGNRWVQWNADGNTWAAYNEQTKQWYAVSDYTPPAAKAETVTAISPWFILPPEQRPQIVSPEAKVQIVALAAATQSGTPILRGDWFVYATGIQEDRAEHGYYNFLAIKDQASFERLIGFDAEALKRFPIEAHESVAASGVSFNSRRIRRFGKIGGAYWITDDVKVAKDEKDPLSVLDKDLKIDAHRAFGHLSNGAWAYLLAAAADGKLQNFAPIETVGADKTAHNNRMAIEPARGCVTCHASGSGLLDFKPFYRGRAATGRFSLQSPDKDIAKRLGQIYGADLQMAMEDDRRIFTRFVKTCNGLTPAESGALYGQMWASYDSPVSPEAAAAEFGVTREFMVARFAEYLAKTGAIYPPLSLLMDGEPIPRVAFENGYVLGQLALRGLVLADLQRIVIEVQK